MTVSAIPRVAKATLRPSQPPAASWTQLAALTTVGIDPFGRLRLTVHSDPPLGADQRFRLIVQSYEASELADGNLPVGYDRPTASAQRSVSGEELARGVDVVLVEPRPSEPTLDRVVFAWLEPGEADLEFDALGARPLSEALLGRTHLSALEQRADIVLRQAAA